MSAQRKMKTYETIVNEAAPVTGEVGSTRVAKRIALFLAAPFIGLAYLLAMPLVGVGLLAWIAVKALAARIPVVNTVALAVAAPCIGLVCIITAPFVGLGALACVGSGKLATR